MGEIVLRDVEAGTALACSFHCKTFKRVLNLKVLIEAVERRGGGQKYSPNGERVGGEREDFAQSLAHVSLILDFD